MFILFVIIIFAVAFYVYYKVAILRSTDELVQLYFNARSRVALGTFMLAAGIFFYLMYESTLSLVIGLIFAVLGALQFVRGFNESRHYQKEYRRLRDDN
ncbi:MAG TPA: YtpI family protein [Bacillota bacterium]|nr:YtpI family protein [Bacillota bacterium]